MHVSKPFGFTYLNDKRHLRFMQYNEIHKFCDATLKDVRDGLVKRLQDIKNEFKKKPHGSKGQPGTTSRWNSSVQRQVRQFVHRIEERLYRRDQIRRLESYLGARPAFPHIRSFQRPEALFTDFNQMLGDL